MNKKPGAILEFDDREYQVRVSGAPYQDGNEWVYTCFIADGQSNSYIPGKLLAPVVLVPPVPSLIVKFNVAGELVPLYGSQ